MIDAFANITIQDTDRIVRAFKDDWKGTSLKIAAGITLPSVLLWFANHDDPRYAEIPQWEKDLFYLVLTKDHIFRIPKPFGTGVLFGSGAEHMLEKFVAGNPDAGKRIWQSLSDTLFPAVVPTAVAPIINQFANRSTFSNQTLIPSPMEKYLPEYQFTPYTTELSKAIGRNIGPWMGFRNDPEPPIVGGVSRAISSPILIENYVRGWTGGLGMYLLDFADWSLRKSGVLPDPVLPTKTLADIPSSAKSRSSVRWRSIVLSRPSPTGFGNSPWISCTAEAARRLNGS